MRRTPLCPDQAVLYTCWGGKWTPFCCVFVTIRMKHLLIPSSITLWWNVVYHSGKKMFIDYIISHLKWKMILSVSFTRLWLNIMSLKGITMFINNVISLWNGKTITFVLFTIDYDERLCLSKRKKMLINNMI